jgi:hypothetical protein
MVTDRHGAAFRSKSQSSVLSMTANKSEVGADMYLPELFTTPDARVGRAWLWLCDYTPANSLEWVRLQLE